MDLKELRAFLAVAEELNFNRAAERLNMSQPPLTRLIKKLEQSLGAQLFVRTTRSVELTPSGERLLREAEPLLAEADRLARMIRHEVADRTRVFGIGCTALALHTILPKVIPVLSRKHPKTELDIEELPSERLMADLQAAEIDFGLTLLPQDQSGIAVRPLLKQRMRLAVSRTHPLAKKRRAALSDFSQDKFIMHLKGDAPAMYDEIVRCCAVAGFRPRMVEKKSNNTCTGLVAANIGVHFVAGTNDCLASHDLAFIDIEDPAPVLELGAVWREDDPSELLHECLGLCQQAVA